MAAGVIFDRSVSKRGPGLLCVPVQARDASGALAKVARAGALADLVELRLDLIPSPPVEVLVKASPVPVIATVRSRGEGGAAEGAAGTTVDLLLRALKAGAAYVDVELGLPGKMRRILVQEAGPHRVVLSRHMTGRTPSREALIALLERMTGESPAVVKIVCRARRAGDAFRVLSLVPRARARGIGVSAFCMGERARASRILSLRLGATLGYASLDEGDGTAEGQIPIRLMRRMLAPLRDRPFRTPSGLSLDAGTKEATP